MASDKFLSMVPGALSNHRFPCCVEVSHFGYLHQAHFFPCPEDPASLEAPAILGSFPEFLSIQHFDQSVLSSWSILPKDALKYPKRAPIRHPGPCSRAHLLQGTDKDLR